MKKTTYVNKGIISLLLITLFCSNYIFAQLPVPFSPRLPGGSIKVKGDIILIGNGIVTGKDLPLPYNGTEINNDNEGVYINVASGGDPSIFSSSSANLSINNSCKDILYAGLYWASVYPLEVANNVDVQFEGTPRFEDWNQIKFKLPTGGFIDLVADNNPDPVGEEDDIIFDGYEYYGSGVENSFKDSPIICYKNVTNLLQGLSEADGEYTVANLRATRGVRRGGCSAGWTLVVIYESPILPSKFISVFDGYAGVQNTTELDIPVSGFQTLPSPLPVNSNLGVAALEGDIGIPGDSFQFKASTSGTYTVLSDAINQPDNFFNSSITLEGVHVTNRNPASLNTLGLDINNFKLPNPLNSVLPNNATAGDLKLTTNGDGYGVFLTSFAVEIIEPKITLTKVVEDTSGNDISNQLVDLGDELNYIIGFQNTGNDDATNLTIRDVLPINIDFNYPADLEALPPGVTVQSYNPLTRELIFNVDDSVVEENDPVQEIRFKVSVVSSCSLLDDACSNVISNQAYVTYNGTINSTFAITDDPSLSANTGCLITPAATNFLADLNCTFEEEVILCGDNVVLTAGNGYDAYSWSTSPSGTPVIGTTQSITVTTPGTYYVHNTALAPCQSIDQVFNVITFGANVTNPIIPFADQVVTCPNDGKSLPNIFLCGGNDSRFIQTGITDTTSIIWEKLDETSCTAVINQDCANEDSGCTWNQVTTGPDFMADTAGQYRLTLNYTGGCFNQFYFNIYTNLLVPTATTKDIICKTPGEINVGGVPSGYEYSIDGVNYQPSNLFSITSPGIYSVYVRQIGVTPNPCIFSVPDVQIRQRDFTVSTNIIQPFCNGDFGSVIVAANDVRPQYYFSIYNGATLVNSVGPIIASDYRFNNLNPGTYTINVSTEDGCIYSEDIEIINPPLLTATAALTKPLTCTDGEITVYPDGGTPPYYYFVNSTTVFQGNPEIVVTASGVYNITVVDSNNCSADASITVNASQEPDFNVLKTDILCYNSNTGEIHFNVTNANGYAITYSIDNGTTFQLNDTFSNLSAGTYQALIKYSLGGTDCLSVAQDITITQPDTALTASAGISELAGCGPSGEGKVRITNPQGGTPPYEYSFDNQATWITVNEADVTPGTYTLYIRDANGCIYAMPDIVLDPEPVTPTIDVSDPDFNCNGTANATVTVTNSNSSNTYTYTYLLDGVENTNTADPKTFLDVPEGSHTISVAYKLKAVPTYSNLLLEDFGYGDDTTSPGINPVYYCFERQKVGTECKGSIVIQDGDYSVTSNIVKPYGAWVNPVDHTPATIPPTPKGRYLVVNIGATIPKTEILYEKQIDDIIPNQPINVEFFAMNLLKAGNTQYNADLLVALVDGSGNEISSFATGEIPKIESWEQYPKTPLTLDPGANTSLKFIVRSNVQQTSGNDVAIDDIRVYQLPKTCITQVDFPFVVESGKAFTANITGTSNVSCSGGTDGSITIAAQNFDPLKGFQYSIDSGVTWNTQMTSPYTITGLAEDTYDIQIRYDDTANSCDFPYTQNITTPALLTVSVSATPVTCLDGSTVTATTSGGTPAYSYELLDTSLNLVANFPSSGILTSVVQGDYIVRATDANGCTDDEPLSLVAPTTPTATIINADYCYDATNGASLEVSASGGQSPYQYNINGGAFQSSNIFTNLTPGTYDIIVRDSFGCTFSLPTQTISSQVKVSMLTKDLDCTATPDATITGTISGGVAPYTYEVSVNSGAYTPLGTTGSPFIYNTTIDGTYQFQITDANGCSTQSTVETINPISLPEITSVIQTQPILCSNDSNAAIQVNINNAVGTPSFVINVFNNTTGVDYGTQTSGLTAGDYTITLTDAKSCTDTATITIAEPAPIDFDLDQVDITCNGLGGTSLGSIIVQNVTGGTAPFTYYITNNFGDVIPGNPYAAVSNEDYTFTVINYGIYTIDVVDANGCSLTKQVTMASPPSDLLIDVTTFSSDCTNGGTAVVQAISAVGSGSYEFGILESNTAPYTSTFYPATGPSDTRQFDNLIPGVVYTFVVHDLATDCYYVKSANAPIAPASSLTSTVVPNNVVCKGDSNGSVTFTIDNFDSTTTSVDYQIFEAFSNVSVGAIVNLPVTFGTPETVTTPSPGTLAPGQYYIVFTENGSGAFNGCKSASAIFEIKESAVALSATASAVKNQNCNALGQISVIGHDGTAPYTYQVLLNTDPVPASTDPAWVSTNTFDLPANSYIAYVKDDYGCIQAATPVILDADPVPVIAALVNNQCTATEGNFIIDVSLTTAGIAPYSYSIDGSSYQSRTAPFTITNLTSGSHTIEVKDSNGCGNLVSVDIVAPLGLMPTVTTLPSCSDDDGVITVTGSGGSGNYTYAISPNVGSISGNVISGVPSGTYTVTITDTTTLCTQNANITLDVATPVTFTTTPTNVSCNGSTDGTITVNLPASNDNPIYTYSIDGGVTTQTSNVFTGLASGIYNITVTSGKNCTLTQQETVGEPDPINVPTPTVVGYACTTGTNTTNFASITVSGVIGGSGTYTVYEFIKGGVTVQSGSNNQYIESDLSGGTYTINVYDDNGCSGTITATIAPYIELDKINVVINPITCKKDEDITVSVSSIGGTPTNLEYTVEDVVGVVTGGVYSQTNTTGIFTGLTIGNYVITVTNLDTGCSLQKAHYVSDPNTFDLTIDSVVDVTCFSASDGSVNLTFIDRTPSPTDESGPFSYSVIDSLGNTVDSGTSLSAGPITLSGFASGTYEITAELINDPRCPIDKKFTITAPTAALAISETHTDITCVSGNNDGSISATATGGWPGGYEYQLEITGGTTPIASYSSVSNFTGLTPGDYVVSVRDSRGCIASDVVTLAIPIPIAAIVTPSTTLLSCFGDKNATITVSNPMGGQGSNYTYMLNMVAPTASSSGPQSSPVFTGLGAGTYNVTVTDGYNCEFTSTDVVISEPAQIQATLVKSTSQTCLTGTTLTLSATGGTGSYEYSDTASFTTILGSFASSTPINLPQGASGTYSYYVRDTNNCYASVSNEITIDPLPTLEVNIDVNATNTEINCAGDTTGVIVVTAQGGLGSYVYTLQDGIGTNISPLNQNTTGVFTDLPVGSYQIRVDSGDCLTTSSIIPITEPSLPLDVRFTATDVTCTGANNGLLEIAATGGTGIIKYAISPQLNQFFESPIFENLAPGNYQAIAQDELGCFVLFDFVINDPIPVSLNIVPNSIIPELCNGDANGAFSIEISGGELPYSVALDDINGVYTTGALTQTQFDFTNLSGGDHVVYVSDALGCESEWNITFPESVLINPVADVEYGCSNNLSTNTVTVNVDDSITDLSNLTYSLDGGAYQASNIFTNVPAGLNHYIDVSHTNGCTKRTEFFDIIGYDPLTLVLQDGELNQIVAVASGGSGDYEFTLNGEPYGSEDTFIIYASGDYTVTVTDRFGCVASDTRYYEYIDVCIPNYFTPNDDGNLDEWGPGCTNQYKDLKFNIFDRYGRKVATLRVGEKWDGKYKGAELPSGDYWYVVKLNDIKDNRQFVGHFTLYR